MDQFPYSPLLHDANGFDLVSSEPWGAGQQSILHWVGPSFASDLSEYSPISSSETLPLEVMANMQTAPIRHSRTPTRSCQQDACHLPYEEEQFVQRQTPSPLVSNKPVYPGQQQRLGHVLGELEQLQDQQRVYTKGQLRAIRSSMSKDAFTKDS